MREQEGPGAYRIAAFGGWDGLRVYHHHHLTFRRDDFLSLALYFAPFISLLILRAFCFCGRF